MHPGDVPRRHTQGEMHSGQSASGLQDKLEKPTSTNTNKKFNVTALGVLLCKQVNNINYLKIVFVFKDRFTITSKNVYNFTVLETKSHLTCESLLHKAIKRDSRLTLETKLGSR